MATSCSPSSGGAKRRRAPAKAAAADPVAGSSKVLRCGANMRAWNAEPASTVSRQKTKDRTAAVPGERRLPMVEPRLAGPDRGQVANGYESEGNSRRPERWPEVVESDLVRLKTESRGDRLGVGRLADLLRQPRQPEPSAAARQVVDAEGRHRDGRGGADEHAGDARSQQNARSPRGASGKNGELVAAMPFGYPRRLATEAFGELHTVDDLGRAGAPRERYADSSGICHMSRHSLGLDGFEPR